jgi:hypothetical protein
MSGRSIPDISKMTTRDILEQPVSGIASKRTPRNAFELPNTDFKKEPRGLWDGSGSNLEFADPEETITKLELVCGAMPILAKAMAGDDSEAAGEQKGGSFTKGGLLSIVYSYNRKFYFAPGEDESEDERFLGDMNEANALEKVERYRKLVNQRQMTYFAPALEASETAFNVEFPDATDRCRLDLGLGDGKFDDPQAADRYFRSANPMHCIAFGAIGYGDAHDRFVEHLEEISSSNDYFTYAALTGCSDPLSLALDLRLLSGTAKS